MIIIYVAAVVTAATAIGILVYLYRESQQIEAARKQEQEPEIEKEAGEEAVEQPDPLNDEPDTTEKE